jgi:cobalt/nickel transport system permease protein
MGFITCFIAYPLIYKYMTRKGISRKSIMKASMVSSIIGLHLGAFGVVLETLLSGKTELPFLKFLVPMQLIHLAISIVEGLVTAAIITFVWKARPEILEKAAGGQALGNIRIKRVLIGLLAAAVIAGGGLSLFASSYPDGLEWSIEKTAGAAGVENNGELSAQAEGVLPSINVGTSISGIAGGALTLGLAAAVGVVAGIVKRKKRKEYRTD